MGSINLINPINVALAQIKESLFERELIISGNESIFYGTYKTEFDKFYIRNKRAGKNVFKIDFFNSKLEELNNIEIGILNIERQLENLKFTSTLKSIIEIRHLISELISDEAPAVNSSSHKKKEKTILTYKWIAKKELKNTLYLSLLKNNLIDKKTKYDDFRLVFDNKNIKEIKNQIIWYSSTASELLYFIIKIQDVFIESKKRQDYLLLKYCFTKRDGVKFSENFKNINTELEIKLSTSKQRVIDKMIQEISQ